jgi:hypothetical protein
MKRFLILLLLFVPLAARATCSQEDAAYELKRTDRAYEEATKLKTSLEQQGIEVTCVLPSKSVRMFGGQLGAAFYRTSVGFFTVMFMPEAADFQVRVVQTRRNGRYFYSFEGKPPADTKGLDASHQIYFIQHRNLMFSTDDEKLAERLRRVFS